MSSYFMYIQVYVMKHFWFKFLGMILAGFAVSVAAFPSQGQVRASSEAQSGVVVTVTYSEPINVRGGPSTVYYPGGAGWGGVGVRGVRDRFGRRTAGGGAASDSDSAGDCHHQPDLCRGVYFPPHRDADADLHATAAVDRAALHG